MGDLLQMRTGLRIGVDADGAVLSDDAADGMPHLNLDADRLRWLVLVAGPAALIAIGAQPTLSGPAFRDPPTPPDEHATNVERPLGPSSADGVSVGPSDTAAARQGAPAGAYDIDPGTDDEP